MRAHSLIPVLAIACMALVAGTASAQTFAQTAAARLACVASVKTLCPTQFAAHDRDAARACLLKNLSKASPDCVAAVKAAGFDKPAPGHSG